MAELFLLVKKVIEMSNIEGRNNYFTIKSWLLETYYDFCRDRGIVMGKNHLEVIGYIDYEYENAFEIPLEQLMYRVVELVLIGGWHDEIDKFVRQKISAQLKELDLEELLVGADSLEVEMFKRDLSALGLI